MLKLTNELYECGEALMPIVDEICESVQKLAPELRPRTRQRSACVAVRFRDLTRDFAQLMSSLPPSMAPVMTKVPEYMPLTTWSHAPWTGAALLAKLSFLQSAHLEDDYSKSGPRYQTEGADGGKAIELSRKRVHCSR